MKNMIIDVKLDSLTNICDISGDSDNIVRKP